MTTRIGSLVAEALTGSWRTAPPPPSFTARTWTAVAPVLQATAAAGLGWWRVRGSTLEDTAAARQCRDAYRIHALEARLQEERLTRALDAFSSANIRPILAKGWAAARHYPRSGLRPYGDLDLHVAPEDHAPATELLRRLGTAVPLVDLHRGVPLLGRPWAHIAARSVEVPLGATKVAVLGPADHLALLCVHFLSHGAWRPLWLCDVALLLEEAHADVDWDHLAALPPRQVEEVRLVALLAHRLLGAGVGATPWRADEPIPGWLPRATLAAWSRGGHYSVTTRIALTDAHPRRFLRAARLRWPNPIEATVRWGAPYNALPRLPYQLLDVAVRSARALAGAPSVVGRRRAARDEGEEQRRQGGCRGARTPADS